MAEVEGDWAALAALVKTHRRRLGIPTQGAAAERAGFSPNTWQRLENGKPISMRSLSIVAAVLGWDPTYPMKILEHGIDALSVDPKPTQDAPEPARPQIGAIGVGSPAVLHLQAFGREIDEAFGHLPFLVGSAARGKVWRDVDVRLMLPDDEFDTLFPGHSKPDSADGRWALMCAAISELGRVRTGLPIDFQIQRMTDANAQYDGVRHALGVRLRWNA